MTYGVNEIVSDWRPSGPGAGYSDPCACRTGDDVAILSTKIDSSLLYPEKEKGKLNSGIFAKTATSF